MSDIIILNNPKFDTITVSETIEILSQKTKIIKFDKKDEQNKPNIKKVGNFAEWEIAIYQKDLSDNDWTTLKNNLLALNKDSLFLFTPDTIDNPSVSYLSYLFFIFDDLNEYPVDFIWCKILRYYSNENEA